MLFIVLGACAPSPDTELSEPPLAEYAVATVWTPEAVEAEAYRVAERHQLDAELFTAVVKCESSFDVDAIGDNGTSYGPVQIHLPSHPTVTKEEATDPHFALEWMAQRWLEGDEWMWSCWRLIHRE